MKLQNGNKTILKNKNGCDSKNMIKHPKNFTANRKSNACDEK